MEPRPGTGGSDPWDRRSGGLDDGQVHVSIGWQQGMKTQPDSAEAPDGASGVSDVLADVLDTLRFRGSIFFRSQLARPWGMRVLPEGFPVFHMVYTGRCYVGISGSATVEANQHEIIVVPGGHEHWIADEPGRALAATAEVEQARLRGKPMFQDGEPSHQIMCGLLRFDQNIPHPILSALPEIMHFPRSVTDASFWATVELIDSEIRNSGRKTGQIIDRLTEVLFLQLLLGHVNASKERPGFFGALHDRRVYQALALIHGDPGHHWTLNELGEAVGMSRATLVRQFQDSVGVAPIKYLYNWRIAKVYHHVKYTLQPLDQIADNLGFASVSTMNKAFRRQHKCTPAQIRSQHPACAEIS